MDSQPRKRAETKDNAEERCEMNTCLARMSLKQKRKKDVGGRREDGCGGGQGGGEGEGGGGGGEGGRQGEAVIKGPRRERDASVRGMLLPCPVAGNTPNLLAIPSHYFRFPAILCDSSKFFKDTFRHFSPKQQDSGPFYIELDPASLRFF